MFLFLVGYQTLELSISNMISHPLVPALAVSLLLNLVTGGAIVTNLVSPTDRSDSEPFQGLQSQL